MADGRQVSAAEKKEEKKAEGSLGKGLAETENRMRGFQAVVRRAKAGGRGELS